MTKAKIDKNTTLEKILKIKGAEVVLEKYGLPCMHCPMAQTELPYLKLGDVCMNYGIDLEKVLKELGKLK